MNNIKWIKENISFARKALIARQGSDKEIDVLIKTYESLKTSKTELEELTFEKNTLTKQIRTSNNREKLLLQIKKIGNKIEALQEETKIKNDQYTQLMLELPNLNIKGLTNKKLHNTPMVVSREEKNTSKNKIPHWEIYQELDLVNFNWGVKVGGSRFITYTGKGAKLRRAIMAYQIDEATKKGYMEVVPPVLAKHQSLLNSGHFPKFKEDVFCIDNWDLALVGTAETAICNFYSNEIIQTSKLPLRFSSTTMNFRSESGSAGKDTRGAIRMHQFTKTELFTFCTLENEEKELEKMLSVAKSVISQLKIPFIVKRLPLNDIGFSASITYDLEVWMPSSNNFREVSSVSSTGNFQSIRGKIRNRETNKEPTEFCCTLNGTAVAIDRIMAAICENNYNEKTKVISLPKVLHKYYGDTQISS